MPEGYETSLVQRYTRWSDLRGQQTAFPHQIPPFVHQVIYQGAVLRISRVCI